ncbi:hypothetical protein ACFPIF_19530 [Brevundimonas faecalis]|uniref:hypothetical protein n=1 Tax=Brevundimonas faecalis TaxID=947378 RepID=UPI00360E8FC6
MTGIPVQRLPQADIDAAVRDAGLIGWTASVYPDDRVRGRHLAVLISPDFNPDEGAGWIITRRGTDPADAFALALTAAEGKIH